jgi:hypothetical protein
VFPVTGAAFVSPDHGKERHGLAAATWQDTPNPGPHTSGYVTFLWRPCRPLVMGDEAVPKLQFLEQLPLKTAVL